MLSAEALERNEGMGRKKKDGRLGKSAAFYILISVWRAGGRWGLASVPAGSLGLVVRLTWRDGEAWPGIILLQGSEDTDISPDGLQGEKPDHLAQCCWVPGGDGTSATAAFMDYWG